MKNRSIPNIKMKRADFTNKEWDNIKGEIHSILVGVAKSKKLINYSDLVKRMKTVTLHTDNVDEVQILAELLGEISGEENKHARGMLSALVIHKTGDREPGLGFFVYAK